jgi:hypothetical protein
MIRSAGAALKIGSSSSQAMTAIGRRRFSQQFRSSADRDTYLRDANAKMKEYHQTRELMRQGKIKSKRPSNGMDDQRLAQAQFAVAGVFVLAFLSTPFLGRKIATDADFRAKWIPAWYDFTVQKPEKAWKRQELHEQALEIQRDIRERAIRGEFTPEKLEEMRLTFQGMEYPHREGMDRSKVPVEWDRLHPGLDETDGDE